MESQEEDPLANGDSHWCTPWNRSCCRSCTTSYGYWYPCVCWTPGKYSMEFSNETIDTDNNNTFVHTQICEPNRLNNSNRQIEENLTV